MDALLATSEDAQARATAARAAMGARLAQLPDRNPRTYWKAVAQVGATSTENLVDDDQRHAVSAVRVRGAELIDTGRTLALRFETAGGSEQILLVPLATAADLIHAIGQVFARRDLDACGPVGGAVLGLG